MASYTIFSAQWTSTGPTKLTCAIHAAVKQLNKERQMLHPCGNLNKAA